MLAFKHSFYILLLGLFNFYLLILSAYIQAWNKYEFIWMWVLAFNLFSYFKIVTALDFNFKKVRYPFFYHFLWIGMNPSPFKKRFHFKFVRKDLIAKGLLNTAIGLLFFKLASFESHWYLQSWLFCVSIVFLLHFGTFNILAWFLNLIGFRVESIMNNPLHAKSLKEFWGGRWNRAFNDLVVPIIYKPIKQKWGKTAGIFGVFLFSGLVHEIVISLSVGQGFFGPLIYFLMQGFGLYLEEKYRLSRFWMYFFIIGPMGLLFHPAFMAKAIYPWIELDLL
tara:strand:- start:1572 stop:2408 length:837 start_codon:yes stop_codon:yes gene_type:complete